MVTETLEMQELSNHLYLSNPLSAIHDEHYSFAFEPVKELGNMPVSRLDGKPLFQGMIESIRTEVDHFGEMRCEVNGHEIKRNHWRYAMKHYNLQRTRL